MSPYTSWDVVAMAGAAVSCLATMARRHMLSEQLQRYHSAPWSVQLALSFQAIVTAGVALSLFLGAHHASQIETLLLLVSGVVSGALWHNLRRQGRPPAEGRRSPPQAQPGRSPQR